MRLTVVRGPSPVGPFDLHPGLNHAGRDAACEVCLPSKRVSRKHAVFVVGDQSLEVRDLGSHNGILSGQGARVDRLVLTAGERVQIGDYLLKLEVDEDELDLEEEDDVILDEETAEPGTRLPRPPSRSPKPTLAPVTPAPPVAAARPDPAPPLRPAPKAGGVLPAPPKLPFPPTAGFGGGFGRKPIDPDRSIFLEPDEPDAERPRAPDLVRAAPPPWKPTASREPQTTPGPENRLTAAVPLPAPVAPSPAPALPPPLAAGPAAVPPPPANERPPRAEGARANPAPLHAGGLPWLLQATFLLFSVVSVLVCSPFGGVLDLAWSGDAAVEEVSVLRGVALTEALANRNAQPLADQRGIALETTFLLERAGVRAALVADPRGTVLAPAEKLRTSITAQPAYAESSRTGETAVAVVGELRQIAIPVRAQVAGTGPRQIVGYALVEYDPAAVGGSTVAFGVVQGLFVVALTVGMLVVGTWWLVIRPLVALREETEIALLGDQHEVVPPMRLAQFEQLAHSINRLAARARGIARR